MDKIECLKQVVARGYFQSSDADVFQKACVLLTPGDMEFLGIELEDAGSHFYKLSAYNVEPEVIQAGIDMGLNVINRGEYVTFSLL